VAISFLPMLLLHVGGSLMNGWMWQPMEAEAINRREPRSKGARTGPEIGQAGRPGPTSPSLFRPVSVFSRSPMLVDQMLTCSLMHVGL
jgi:hypothetical protein